MDPNFNNVQYKHLRDIIIISGLHNNYIYASCVGMLLGTEYCVARFTNCQYDGLYMSTSFVDCRIADIGISASVFRNRYRMGKMADFPW